MQDFVTPRLVVSHWRKLLTDPATRTRLERDLRTVLTPPVLQHLPPPLQLDKGQSITRWIDDRAAEAEVYLVNDHHGLDLLGLLILAHLSDRDIHIGYLFAEHAWGKGYASELVQGLVAATPAGITLTGGVGTGNAASARVLIKAGFQLDAEQSTPDTDIFVNTVA